MGFGRGYSSRSDNGGKRYNNDMVAHVWNAQSERAGQSGNGNLFFEGRTLYSYGRHFIVGYIMPDGVAFLNADSYSVSTSGHQSDANRAVRDRSTFHVANLTDMARSFQPLDRLARWIDDGRPAAEKARMQTAVRDMLRENATALTATIRKPGEYRYSEVASDAQSAGAYIASLAGLPAASWPKLQREAAKAAADAETKQAAAERAVAERRALQLADMPDRQWREWVADLGTGYSDHNMREVRKDLTRARGLMLKAKRGKLAAASRLETVRRRIKSLTAEIETFAERHAGRKDRAETRRYIAIVRNWRDASTEARMSTHWATVRDLATAGERLADRGRIASLKASAERLARDAHCGMDAIATENARLQRLAVENAAKAEADKRAAWLAGEPVAGRVYFDAETGGAALRVRGDTLQTSHGAEVPLSHAIKVFRFIKQCRDTGTDWHRNGRTIRVGHFQVDSISAAGDFRAGCHSFTWPEVERVARIAGVFDCPADDSALEPSAAAA